MDTDFLGMLTRAADSAEAVLSRLDEASQSRPSPCPEMNVGQVATHLIGGIRAFTEVAEGGELRFGPDPEAGLGAEPAGVAFREAIDRLTIAFAVPGRIEATYAMPWGPTTGVQLVAFLGRNPARTS